MNLWKYSGIFLILTGIIHNVTGIGIGWEVLASILSEGLVNSVNQEYDRNAVFWFLATGFFWIVLGHMLHRSIKNSNKPAPPFVGWYMLAFAIVGCAISPVSGIWLFFPQSLIILTAKV